MARLAASLVVLAVLAFFALLSVKTSTAADAVSQSPPTTAEVPRKAWTVQTKSGGWWCCSKRACENLNVLTTGADATSQPPPPTSSEIPHKAWSVQTKSGKLWCCSKGTCDNLDVLKLVSGSDKTEHGLVIDSVVTPRPSTTEETATSTSSTSTTPAKSSSQEVDKNNVFVRQV